MAGEDDVTAVMKDLADWADEWLPPELVGGIRGRRANELYERIMAVIDSANQKGHWFMGPKIDL